MSIEIHILKGTLFVNWNFTRCDESNARRD